MDKKKRQIFGNDVVHRIRLFVFRKRKVTNTNNRCVIPKSTAKQLSLTNNIQTIHLNKNSQHWEKIEQQHEEHEQEQKERKNTEQDNKMQIPFSLFLRCVKKSVSTKKARRQLMWQSYLPFWDYLFCSCAAQARMVENDEQYYDNNYYDFVSDFDEDFF